MIHHTPLLKFKTKLETSRGLGLYCFLGIALCFVNFAPVFEAHDKNIAHFPVDESLRFWFGISFFLSLPLWSEFCIDVLLKRMSSSQSTKQRLFDYDFGHTALLLSMSLPLYLFIQPDEEARSLLFAECFISACRTLTLVAIFGKLQVFSDGHWNVCNSIPMITTIVIVEVLNSFGLSRCGANLPSCKMKAEFNPQIFMALCIVLNTVFARRYIFEFYKLRFTKEGSTFFDVSRYAALSSILIVEGYLVTRFLMAFVWDYTNVNRTYVLEYKVLVLVVLATLAAILPGRMVRRMLVTMKDEMSHKETFIRYISHEIRSPLSTATLGLDFLIKQLSDSKQMDLTSILDIVRDARYSAETATNTLNDLLMFDKIKSGMLELSKEKCDMWEFVQHSLKPFRIQASSANVALNWHLHAKFSSTEPQLPAAIDIESQQQQQFTADCIKVSAILVQIDKYKMEQVVRNFMTNALKFTPSGGSITVNVTLQSHYSTPIQKLAKRESEMIVSDRIVRMEVIDTGPGIIATNLPKLFGHYVQFDANTLQGGKGSGLGLWLSKSIVEMHGGVIGATSEGAGRGCTFFLELPVMELCVDDGDGSLGGDVGGAVGPALASKGIYFTDGDANGPGTSSKSLKYQIDPITIGPATLLEPSSSEAARSTPAPAITSPQAMAATTATTTAETGSMSLNVAGKAAATSSLAIRYHWKSTPSALLAKQKSSSEISVSRRTKTSPHSSRILDSISPYNSIRRKPISVDVITKLTRVCPAPSEAETFVEQRVPWHTLRVLIVDDSQLARKMVTRTLSALDGCVCEHASNGKEAVDKVMESQSITDNDGDEGDHQYQRQQKPYDVILMDFYMPVMNGPDAVRTLRSPLCDYTGLILAVTGVSAESEFDSLLEAGLIDHILVKPFDLTVFRMCGGTLQTANVINMHYCLKIKIRRVLESLTQSGLLLISCCFRFICVALCFLFIVCGEAARHSTLLPVYMRYTSTSTCINFMYVMHLT